MTEESTDVRVERQWARTAQTRENILDAARAVFLEHGYADAAVAEVVDRSGSSVGSIYHHFGGKAELFLSLYHRQQETYVDAASRAVAKARESGEHDPVELFITGSRAFLETAWRNRALARLFLDGDGPPGFATLQRQRGKEWIRQNAVLLRAADDSAGRVKVTVITGMIGDGTREITSTENRRAAKIMIDATLAFVRAVAETRG